MIEAFNTLSSGLFEIFGTLLLSVVRLVFSSTPERISPIQF